MRVLLTISLLLVIMSVRAEDDDKVFKTLTRTSTSTPTEITTTGGTSFYISKNTLLTAAHIIQDNSEIVLLSNGNEFPCKVLKIDKNLDICLLQCDRQNKSWYEIDPVAKDVVTTIAFPGASKIKVEEHSTIYSLVVRFSFEPGSSGAPLIMNGKVIGIGLLCSQKPNIEAGFFLTADKILKFLNSK